MPYLHLLSPSQQVARHLRGELSRRRWRDEIPGAPLLAAELGIDRKTIDAALRLLEEEGVLVAQGTGRRRRIVLPEGGTASSLRVAILVDQATDRRRAYMVGIQRNLLESGHSAFYAEPYMEELGMEVPRIAGMVERTEADAWVVVSSPRELLEWFAAQGKPVFALFGRMRKLRIAGAGTDKPSAYAAATRCLIGLGHRRIVLLARRRRRLPEPGAPEQAFLGELAAHGLPVGDYNLPGWEETISGFQARLDSLFHLTPPTALIIDEASLFAATQQFLARRRLQVPEDVSLVCTDADPTFEWGEPSIAHMRWDSRPIERRLIRWAANVSRGKQDLRQTLTRTEFVSGGTIGPASK